MWRQLVVCCNIFGVKYTEREQYGKGLQLFERAQFLLQNDGDVESVDAFVGKVKIKLKAFLWDSFAYYYYRRRKPSAATEYVQKAIRVHVKLEQWEHVAKCQLHAGAILGLRTRYDEAIHCLTQILELVEDERLEVGGTSAQKICMVAVCYHNIAVSQLNMNRVAEACVSSQNARRLARLSMSYSNRWLKYFETTHKAALTGLASLRSVRSSIRHPDQRELFSSLSKVLYS